MTSKQEFEDRANAEFRLLNRMWHETFSGDNANELWDRDMSHPPLGLRVLVEGVLTEGVKYINDVVTPWQLENDPDASEMSDFDRATTNLLALARVIAIRMYHLGNKAAPNLYFDNLTECPCRVLFDDELESLLKEAMIKDLVGDTWVIKDFDPNKKPEL